MDDALRFSQVPAPGMFSGPLVTREKFAELTGLPIGVVQGMVARGYLPTVKIGKWGLINISLLHKRCIEKEYA